MRGPPERPLAQSCAVLALALLGVGATAASMRGRLASVFPASPVAAQDVGAINSPTPAKGPPALFKAETAPPSAAPVRSADTADVKTSTEAKERAGQRRVFEYFTKGLGKFRVILTPTKEGKTAWKVEPIKAGIDYSIESGVLEDTPFPTQKADAKTVQEAVFQALSRGIRIDKEDFMHSKFVRRGWETLEEKPQQ